MSKTAKTLTDKESGSVWMFVDDLTFYTDRTFEMEDIVLYAGQRYMVLQFDPTKDQPSTWRNPDNLPYFVSAMPEITDDELEP